MNEDEIRSQERENLARKGGTATLQKHGRAWFQELNRRSHEAKRLKKASKNS